VTKRPPASAARAFFGAHFEALGRPERAAGEKAYLKSPLDFHGVTVPEVRAACADFCREHPGLDAAALREAVDALMASSYHDERSAGIGLLERRRDALGEADLPWLIGLVRRAANWAHVDWLATKIVGPIVTGRRAAPALLRAWAADESAWVRRTALLAQLGALRAGGGDFALFASIAAPMLPERDVFVRKAVGWVLRDVARRRPELVRDFLREHGARASPLTYREATKRLPAAWLAELPAPASARATRSGGEAPRPATSKGAGRRPR
jgi:3-methyladenine DNA glycosylase AlkD